MGELPTRMTPPTDQYVANTYLSSYSVHLSKYMRSQDRCPIVMLNILNILVGFAPLKPAEFVVIQIHQLAGQIQT